MAESKKPQDPHEKTAIDSKQHAEDPEIKDSQVEGNPLDPKNEAPDESELKEYETEETKDFDIEPETHPVFTFWDRYKVVFTYGFIFLIVLITLLAEILFPGTAFADIVANSLGQFFDITSLIMNNYLRILEALGVLIFVWALNKIVQLLIDILSKKSKNPTAIHLLKSVVKWGIFLLGGFLILTAFGVNSTTLVASVGIIGLVVSFGAQSLVEDVISGLFLIVEKQFAVGEVVIIGDYRGVVKEIGLRTTKIVDALNYDLKIINNSDIRNVINSSQNLSTAICEIGIEYDQDIPKVEKALEKFLPTLTKKYRDVMIEGPTYLGVQTLGDSSVNLRIVAKVLETERYNVQRILNREIKIMFDEKGIGIPFPQIVMHQAK